MTDSIYALYFEMPDLTHTVFYVGHTFRDPDIRLAEHKSRAKNTKHTECVYEFIREVGAEFHMKIVEAIPYGMAIVDYEDFWVMKFINQGEPLQNMKHGDLTQHLGKDFMSMTFRTVGEVRAQRLQVEADRLTLKQKVEANREQTEHSAATREMIKNVKAPPPEEPKALKSWKKWCAKNNPNQDEALNRLLGMSKTMLCGLYIITQSICSNTNAPEPPFTDEIIEVFRELHSKGYMS